MAGTIDNSLLEVEKAVKGFLEGLKGSFFLRAESLEEVASRLIVVGAW